MKIQKSEMVRKSAEQTFFGNYIDLLLRGELYMVSMKITEVDWRVKNEPIHAVSFVVSNYQAAFNYW